MPFDIESLIILAKVGKRRERQVLRRWIWIRIKVTEGISRQRNKLINLSAETGMITFFKVDRHEAFEYVNHISICNRIR
jgi:hypothetical protein